MGVSARNGAAAKDYSEEPKLRGSGYCVVWQFVPPCGISDLLAG